jgi:hypothetical protein
MRTAATWVRAAMGEKTGTDRGPVADEGLDARPALCRRGRGPAFGGRRDGHRACRGLLPLGARVSQSADPWPEREEGATMPQTLSDQALQHVAQHTTEIARLADELADVIAQAGMEQQHSTYMDSRCARIKQLCQDIRAVVGAGTGH